MHVLRIDEMNSNKLLTAKYNGWRVYVLDGNDETGYVLLLNYGQMKKYVIDAQNKVKSGEDVSEYKRYLIYTKPGEWKYKRNTSLRTCYWYGEDAYILGGSKKDGYILLVGNYTEDEAKRIKKLTERDAVECDEYEIIYADPDEWKEQNY